MFLCYARQFRAPALRSFFNRHEPRKDRSDMVLQPQAFRLI